MLQHPPVVPGGASKQSLHPAMALGGGEKLGLLVLVRGDPKPVVPPQFVRLSSWVEVLDEGEKLGLLVAEEAAGGPA